jgi:hypothetical protein
LAACVAFPAKVTKVRGGVQVKRGNAFKKVKRNARLYKGDVVYTGKRGMITILGKDGSLVTLYANARYVVIEDPGKKDKEGTKNMLVSGKAKFNLKSISKLYKDKEESYKLYTPTAVVGVRGTEFDAFSDKNGKSSVAVTEGAVAASTDTLHDTPKLEEGKVIGNGDGFSADKAGGYSEKADIPDVRRVKKELAGKVAPDDSYLDYYYTLLNDLSGIIIETYEEYKKIMTDKAELEKSISEISDENEKNKKREHVLSHGVRAYELKRKVAHRILQFRGYLVLFENAVIKNESLNQNISTINTIAHAIKLY